ncbi:MAG TPA: 3-oxoacyl-[acyl-carrier-protein] reductase [Gemmatimonadales bacterium]|nr:3-oxoacyl-[acyl-carrier-protein] reductase [Gemmatimonadales bacterium]
MKVDLSGKVALITGGTRGIGLASAEAFTAAGAKVALCARDQAKAEEVAKGLEGARGYRCDVGVTADLEALVAQAEKDFGHIDILVNNAGLTRDNLLFRISEGDWDAVQDVNLKAAFLLMKLAGRGMIKRRWGRIINMTSVVGLNGNKGQSNYSAAKAGLVGLTKAAAKELASRNVLVNAVAPGYIDTEMTRGISAEAKQYLQAAIPLARLGEARDVAGAVLFLASDWASYITGQVLVVDGGMVM